MDVASLDADMPRSRNRSHSTCDLLYKLNRWRPVVSEQRRPSCLSRLENDLEDHQRTNQLADLTMGMFDIARRAQDVHFFRFPIGLRLNALVPAQAAKAKEWLSMLLRSDAVLWPVSTKRCRDGPWHPSCFNTRQHITIVGMVDRLNEPESRFHASLVSNVLDLVNLLPKLNVSDDQELNRFAAEIGNKLCGFTARDLKANDVLRVATAHDAAALLYEMDAVLREREQNAASETDSSADHIFSHMSAYMEAPSQ